MLQRNTFIRLCICTVLFIAILTYLFTSKLNKCSLDLIESKKVVVLTDPGMVTTVVTGYFPLFKAKHSSAEYLSWLENLLSFCESPMVIFTSNEYQSTLFKIRHRRSPLPIHFVVDYDSPLEMPPVKRLKSTFEKQLLVDPERQHHTIDLYAIWCAKSFMLNYSAHINHFRSDLFLYIDAGSFRSAKYRFKKWPARLPVQLITESRLLLSIIAPLPRRFCPLNHTFEDKYSPITLDLVQGGLIGGSSSAINWWATAFYEAVDWYRSRKLFIGKDQYLMNAIALAHPNRVMMLISFRTWPSCGDIWFSYGPLLADHLTKSTKFVKNCRKHRSLAEIAIQFEKICLHPQYIE